MTAFKLNTDLLLAPPFRKSGLFVFFTHWFAWIILHFITFFPTVFNSKIVTWRLFVFEHFVLVTINFFLFYVVAFFIMPRMATLPKKWFWVVASSLLLAIVFTYLKFRLETFYNDYSIRQNDIFNKTHIKTLTGSLGFFSSQFTTYFQFYILTNVSIVIVAFAYRLLLLWYQQEKIRKELETQKLQAELSFLKVQVNPHFLFNALNNIYSLSVMEKSNKTGQSIMKLSELMRYVLYEKEDTENRVSIDKEIRHINSYIDLERLRHPGDVYINFSIEGDTSGKRIAPLLLFPFIENACKHGILTDAQKPMDINLQVTDHQLNFSIGNSIKSSQKDEAGGIGIPNVQKRLDLLYGKNYILDVSKTADRFLVNLQLPL